MHKKRSDSRNLSFSQAQGYECVPNQLKLEELPESARTMLWNLFHNSMKFMPSNTVECQVSARLWRDILLDLHCYHFAKPIESEFHKRQIYYEEAVNGAFMPIFLRGKFNKVFDLLTAIMRNEKCPQDYINEVSKIFSSTRLAYFVVTDDPVTILPQATEQEGESIINAFNDLDALGLNGAKSHLRNAGEAINRHEWADSIRHSISAVESVSRQLDPNASNGLGPALKALKKKNRLHPALEQAFQNLYGYTSDEMGIRHALLDGEAALVDSEEAIFMYGACASFVSYLCNKHSSSTRDR